MRWNHVLSMYLKMEKEIQNVIVKRPKLFWSRYKLIQQQLDQSYHLVKFPGRYKCDMHHVPR